MGKLLKAKRSEFYGKDNKTVISKVSKDLTLRSAPRRPGVRETTASSNETTDKHYISSTDNKEIDNVDKILPAEQDGKDFKSCAEQIELNIINGGIETAV